MLRQYTYRLPSLTPSQCQHTSFLPLSPPGWRGIVITVWAGGRAGWLLPNLRNPYLCYLPFCVIWACPWSKNLSNLSQIGSTLSGMRISVTAEWIYPIWSFMELSRPVFVHCHSFLPICSIWACPWAKNFRQHLGQTLGNPYICNHWMDLYHLKFYGIVSVCSCATSWLFDLDLGFSRSNFENAVSQEWKGQLTWNKKGCDSIGCYTHFGTFNVPLTHDHDLEFSRSNFEKKSSILGMGWPI